MFRLLRLSSLVSILGMMLALIVSKSSLAAVPQLIAYQGRLTTSGGAPIEGDKLTKFTLYDGSGTDIWNSGFIVVSYSDGLFSVLLGQSPQPALPSDIWSADSSVTLGVTVDTDPEITPRTRLTTVAYAYHALRADSVAGDPFVNETGDQMTGGLSIDYGSDGVDIDIRQDGGTASVIELSSGGNLKTQLVGSDKGHLVLIDNSGDATAILDATPSGGGFLDLRKDNGAGGAFLAAGATLTGAYLSLTDGASAEAIRLDGNATGDASAVLPADAISGTEILDESVGAADIGPNAVNADEIGTDAVGSAEIQDESVGAADIGPNAVNADEIGTGAVGAAEIAPDAVSSDEIENGSIAGVDLAANSVTSSHITDGTVASADIAADAVNSTHLAANSVGSSEIATSSVGSSEVIDSTITSGDLTNEPGVAQALDITADILTGGPQSVLSRTITCPSDGYVLVIGSCRVTVDHVNGSQSHSEYGISPVANANDGSGDQNKGVTIPTTAPTGTYAFVVSVQKIYSATAGSHTYHLNGNQVNGPNDPEMSGMTLSLLFVPTRSGTLTE